MILNFGLFVKGWGKGEGGLIAFDSWLPQLFQKVITGKANTENIG